MRVSIILLLLLGSVLLLATQAKKTVSTQEKNYDKLLASVIHTLVK